MCYCTPSIRTIQCNKITCVPDKTKQEDLSVMADDDIQLKTLKMCYRKHVDGDDSIGWDELSDAISNCLCERMGNDTFERWVEEECKAL